MNEWLAHGHAQIAKFEMVYCHHHVPHGRPYMLQIVFHDNWTVKERGEGLSIYTRSEFSKLKHSAGPFYQAVLLIFDFKHKVSYDWKFLHNFANFNSVKLNQYFSPCKCTILRKNLLLFPQFLHLDLESCLEKEEQSCQVYLWVRLLMIDILTRWSTILNKLLTSQQLLSSMG